jgi:hypothetical protein
MLELFRCVLAGILSAAFILCIYEYIKRTYILKTREITHIDVWFITMMTIKLTEFVLTFLIFYGYENIKFDYIFINPGFHIIFYTIKFIFCQLLFMFLLKSKKVVKHVTVDKIQSIFVIFSILSLPLYIVYCTSLGSMDLYKNALSIQFFDDLVLFTLYENGVRGGLVAIGIMGLIAFILFNFSNRKNTSQYPLLLFFLCFTVLFLNLSSETGNPKLYFVVSDFYYLLQTILFLKIAILFKNGRERE